METQIILNAVCIGVGSGIGSYFGTRLAEKSMKHLKKIVKGVN
jgi:hypothetical protein